MAAWGEWNVGKTGRSWSVLPGGSENIRVPDILSRRQRHSPAYQTGNFAGSLVGRSRNQAQPHHHRKALVGHEDLPDARLFGDRSQSDSFLQKTSFNLVRLAPGLAG